MPCLPGFLPVMNDVQAGGVSGGIADSSSPRTPLSFKRARLGNLPSSTQGPIKSQVAESKPIITVFGLRIFALIKFSCRTAYRGDEKLRHFLDGSPIPSAIQRSGTAHHSATHLERVQGRRFLFDKVPHYDVGRDCGKDETLARRFHVALIPIQKAVLIRKPLFARPLEKFAAREGR